MKFETKVFINDQDASTFTDDQIFWRNPTRREAN